MKLGDLDAHLHAQRGVEVGQRLVEQEHLRLAHDGPADRDALALPARQLPRLPVEQMLDLQDARGLANPAIDFRPRWLRQSRGRRPCSRRPSCAGRARRTGTPSRCRALPAAGRLTRSPSMEISPEVMSSSPAIRRSSVDLPQPDGPTKTTNSPSRICRSTPWMTSGRQRICEHPRSVTSAIDRSASALALHGAGGQARDDPALEDEDQHDERQGHDHRGRHDVAPGQLVALPPSSARWRPARCAARWSA